MGNSMSHLCRHHNNRLVSSSVVEFAATPELWYVSAIGWKISERNDARVQRVQSLFTFEEFDDHMSTNLPHQAGVTTAGRCTPTGKVRQWMERTGYNILENGYALRPIANCHVTRWPKSALCACLANYSRDKAHMLLQCKRDVFARVLLV